MEFNCIYEGQFPGKQCRRQSKWHTQPPPSCSPGRGPKSPSQPNFANKVILECFLTDCKGVGMPWPKKFYRVYCWIG